MVRRALVVALLVLAGLAGAAVPAAAYEPYLSYPVDRAARLVPGAGEATAAWPAPGAGATTDLVATRFSLDGTARGPSTLVAGIGALDGWYATGEGARVTVVWKDGGSVFVKQVDLGGGPGFEASLSADGTVVPAGVAADGSGGVFVWLASAVAPGSGPTLLNHVSSTGQLRVTGGPGITTAGGTIAAVDVDDAGSAFVLLGPPGRAGLAVQHYAPDLTGWNSPVSVYSAFERPSGAAQTPVGLFAGSTATVAWREGAKVRLQRYSAGGLLWMFTAAVTMAGDVRLADDGLGGAYLVGPSGAGVVARHILASRLEVGAPGSSIGLGLNQPHVGAVTTDRAGDLFAACDDGATTASRVALMTASGTWSRVGPATAVPDSYGGAAPDGAGGACVLGAGGDVSGAVLWRIANASPSVTFRPRARLVQFGKSVTVGGYATAAGGVPVDPAATTILVGKLSGADFVSAANPAAGRDGFYEATVRPTANATWTARAGDVWGDRVTIRVAPRVALSLSHLKSTTRFTEVFSGSVAPGHAGRRLFIQKAAGGDWKTVASSRLDGRSRYRITWDVPRRSATYRLRAMLPAHGDHAQGVSATATLRVVVGRG